MRNLYNLTIKNRSKKGFTIIEVTLSMAFIGMLVIIIAMVLMNILALYQKGLTVKSVNSVGRGLISELTSSINSAPSIDSTSLCNTLVAESEVKSCIAGGVNKFIYQSRTIQKADDNGINHDVQYYGALCTGKYTYIWNTYDAIHNHQTLKLIYNDKATRAENQSISDEFKIIRFEDRNYRTCTEIAQNPTAFESGRTVDITLLPNGARYFVDRPVDGFLDSTDVELYLYELTIFPISQDVVTLRAFFSGTFILATNRGDVNILRTGDYCNPNAVWEVADGGDDGGSGNVLDLGSEFNYCAINKFNFAARTSGQVLNN